MRSVSSRSPNQLASLSAILIVKNEGSQIAECVETLRFCDEIVVVDNNSTDQTVENARKLGCKVIVTTDWPGFGLQKQRALDNAQESGYCPLMQMSASQLNCKPN